MPPKKEAAGGQALDSLAAEMDEAAESNGSKKVEAIDLLEGLDQGLDVSEAAAWKPTEAGATLIGFVEAVYSVSSDYGDHAVPCVDVRDRENTVHAVRGYHTALRSQLERHNPQVGDAIAVRYHGEVEGSQGRTYRSYAVKVRKAGQ